jgi:pimeloyl-ACP methyl ester carboxylesterase
MEYLVDGREAFAATGGRAFAPELPAVVFLHGAGMDHTVWAAQSRYFAHHGRAVLAVDLPGHGRSAGPPRASIGEMATWLLALLDAAGVGEAALVGHSMGALVALETAATAPQRVRVLALLGVAARMPVHPDLLTASAANDRGAIDMINAWAHGPGAHLGGNPQPGSWLIGAGERLLERAAPGVIHSDLAACNDFAEGLARAAEVACPTMVIIGSDDRMTPAKAGRKLADVLAKGRSLLIPEAGHMMMTEKPAAVLAALKKIL